MWIRVPKDLLVGTLLSSEAATAAGLKELFVFAVCIYFHQTLHAQISVRIYKACYLSLAHWYLNGCRVVSEWGPALGHEVCSGDGEGREADGAALAGREGDRATPGPG